MRRYTLTVNEKTMVIDVEAVGADLFRVQLDGRLIDVELVDHRDLAHSAVTPAVAARSVEPVVPLSPLPAVAATETRPTPTGQPGRPRPTDAASGGGRDKVTAPMPGVILSLAVQAGAAVSRGDTLMTLEAMKMKNDLKAPRDGVVAEVYVGVGAQVKFGETLVRFE